MHMCMHPQASTYILTYMHTMKCMVNEGLIKNLNSQSSRQLEYVFISSIVLLREKSFAGLYPLSLKVTSIFQGCLNVHTVVFPSCIRPASRMNAEAVTDCFADLGHSHHDGATG